MRNIDKEIETEAIAFRKAIENIKYDLKAKDRMRHFPRGCCDDVTDLLAYHLYKRFRITTTRVDGDYYTDKIEDNDHHTWLEVNGIIFDLTADQYFDEYRSYYIGTADKFHQRYEQKRQDYRGFIDLGYDCWERMESLYIKIIDMM